MRELSHPPFLHVSLLLCLVAAGCGRAGADGGGTGLEGPDVPLTPVATDLFSVGAFDGEEWETFGRIASVGFDDEGRLYILDSNAMRISVIGPDGRFVRSFGSPGGGPGEIQMPLGWAVLPDGRVTVFDLGKRGFEVFGPAGAYLTSVPVDLAQGGPGLAIQALPDGRLVSANGLMLRTADAGPSGEDEAEAGRPLHVFDLETGEREVLFRGWEAPAPPEGEMRVMEGGGGGQMAFTAMATQAYEADLHFAVRSDGTVAVVDSTGYRVKVIDGQGAVASTVERPIPPQPVTDEVRQAERGRRLEALEDQGAPTLRVIGSGSGGMQLDREQFREMMREQIEAMVFPDVVPVISAMAVDGSDRIWLQRYGPSGEEEGPIDVIGPGAAYLGTVEAGTFALPDAFGPGGLIAYIESDELDVQRVRVARMELPEGSPPQGS